MKLPGTLKILILSLLCALAVSRAGAQGPPYQTDDPVPVDLHHYEFYIFGGVDGTTAEIDSTGPAFEFNWGALPRVQLHAILPWGVIAPSNNPVYLPGGAGPDAFGLTDMELGAKVAWIKETKHFPQIGSFTMFEMPTGNYDKGLGVGKVWYKLLIWLQKNEGKWLFDGGGGYQVVPQAEHAVPAGLRAGVEAGHPAKDLTVKPGRGLRVGRAQIDPARCAGRIRLSFSHELSSG